MRRLILLCGLLVLGPVWPRPVTEAQEKSAPLDAKHQPTLVAQLGHASAVESVAFSPDGKQLLSGSHDATVLWDVATGKLLRRFQGADLVESVAFSPDGKTALTGSLNHKIQLWNVATGKEIQRFLYKTGDDWMGFRFSVAFSADGKQVLAGFNKKPQLWDVASAKAIRYFDGHQGPVVAVTFSPNGKQVLTASTGQTALLSDVATGNVIRRFQANTKGNGNSASSPVAFSADGKRVLTGNDDKTARLWDVATGKELRRFQGHSENLGSVAFSPDGKQVLTGSGDKTVRLWDAATARELRRLEWHTTGVQSVAFSPDGKKLASGSRAGVVCLWEAATGARIRALQGASPTVSSLAFRLDNQQLLTAGYVASAWDLTTGQELRRLQGDIGYIHSVVLSRDGKYLLTGSADKKARLWDASTAKELRQFQGHAGQVRLVAFSPDGKQVLTASEEFPASSPTKRDNTVRLWDVATGNELRRFVGHSMTLSGGQVIPLRVDSLAFSPDGKKVLTTSSDQTARLWDAATGRELRRFQGNFKGRHVMFLAAYSPDGKNVLTVGWDQPAKRRLVRIWDEATGQELRSFPLSDESVDCLALSPDGKQLLTGSWIGRTVLLWDLTTGKELHRLDKHTSVITALAFSPNGKLLVTATLDGMVKLSDSATGKELCNLVRFFDGSWAVVDAAGRFDASRGGDVEGLHWVAGLEPIALKQLKERYYDPGLLAKYLGFNKEPLRAVATFRDVNMFPAVAASAPAPGSGALTLKLSNQGGGIGKVQVFVNGRELLADARGPKFDPDAATASMTVDLADAVAMPGEKNKVRIVTWNAEGYLSSRGLDLDWEPTGRKQPQPMELHAIIAGVSNYSADHLKLTFAAKDAEDMATALVAAGNRLFGADKVHLTLLCDSDDPKALPPTRANFVKAFEAARKARPSDVLVVYLAGHGIALQDKGQETYCYLTREARTANRTAFADPAVREQSALTSAELTDWFKKIPALKQVLILDTCSAGAAASKLIEHRDVGADQIRAIDRLRDRTGFHVLMGCAADKVSYEASQYSQGVLTYSLLQGMRGAKLRLGEYVDVMDLFQYAADQVPQLARNIGGIQKPLVLATRATSFDIGRLKEEDKKRIPLALVRPLLLRPVLQNADENVLDDDLKLVPLLSAKLREESFAAARGKDQAAVFVDADDMPGAIRPSGKYTVEGKTVRVRLVLRRDGQTIASVQVDGTRDGLPGLVQRLTNAIAARLKKL